jgi:hypothetical protein
MYAYSGLARKLKLVLRRNHWFIDRIETHRKWLPTVSGKKLQKFGRWPFYWTVVHFNRDSPTYQLHFIIQVPWAPEESLKKNLYRHQLVPTELGAIVD